MSYKEDCSSDVAKTVSVAAAVVGFLGLAYFAYKKRDSVDWDALKYRSNRILTPLGIGARASGHEIKSFAHDKVNDVNNSLKSIFDKLDTKVSSLSGDAHDKYVEEITNLRNRLDDLLKDTQ